MGEHTFGPQAWEPMTLRSVTMPNRVWMSPMCQYSAGTDGVPNDWHLVHYAARAVGGAGMVMVESTAIAPEHRTTWADLGLYDDEQVAGHRRLSDLIRSAGAVPAVQLQIAGRKSSHQRPWEGKGMNHPVDVSDGGWTTRAPSAIAFAHLGVPHALTHEQMTELLERLADSGRRAAEAGYEVVEVHAAHGYLLQQFLSPLANRRTDEFGGSLQNRMRFPVAAIGALRETWPQDKPLLVRVAGSDRMAGGITVEEAEAFAVELAKTGVDLLDVSSNHIVLGTEPSVGPMHNMDLAGPLRAASALPVASVGGFTDPDEVDRALASGDADAVLVGRELLRDPYWVMRHAPGEARATWPVQYHRAL